MARELIERWIRPQIRGLTAYHVPDARGYIKLDAMENPYSWPAELVEEWLAMLRTVSLNRYPDPSCARLKAGLRAAMEVPDGMQLLLGNGSDELIQMIVMAVAGPGRTILAPEPAFAMYRIIAALVGVDYVGVPLDAQFDIDVAAMDAALRTHTPAVVFLAYPNNPTGNQFSIERIERVIDAAPGLVVLDEAYAAFARDTLMDALERYDNLLVLRTVSKMGLAGLRLGLLAGPAPWLAELDKVRLPYNINVLTQASAEFALAHRDALDVQTRRIREDRTDLMRQLSGLQGIHPFPSDANFILFRVMQGHANEIFEGLRARGVLIKNLSAAGGALADCLRVTVGTPQENQAFIEALRETLPAVA
ncbi:MAG: histidinol-phosphate transaminase [Gammaproteobacteria bacterium]